jgi:hypothetical protein
MQDFPRCTEQSRENATQHNNLTPVEALTGGKRTELHERYFKNIYNARIQIINSNSFKIIIIIRILVAQYGYRGVNTNRVSRSQR